MTSSYRYCGLTLASDWPLPSLRLADWPGAAPNPASDPAPDLEIVLGAVPKSLSDEQRRTATFAHNGREALWWLDGIGRCWISADGRQIRVEPESTSEPEPEPKPSANPSRDQHQDADGDAVGDADSHANALGLMLLHPLMALSAVRRGDWMLNAAAVERDGQVFAFIGPSASGKSTAAALLIRRGFRLVSDGLLRVTRSEDGAWLAHPQAPWLHLWPDTLKKLGLDDDKLSPVRPGLRLTRWPSPCLTEPLPLARIGLLREQRGNDLEDFVPSARAGTRGVETLLTHTAGSTWLEELADRRALFQWAVGLKAQMPLERLEVPWGWKRLEALGTQLADWCGETTG